MTTVAVAIACCTCSREQARVPSVSPDLVAELPGGEEMAFVWIEPGTFRMGSPASDPLRSGDEGPDHEVTITREFYLAQFEITQAQWATVMDTRPWEGHRLLRSVRNQPATNITWNEVQAFIRRLNAAAGDSLYRLPTEADWEHACRAGTTTAWSFGDDRNGLGDHAWYHDNAYDVGLGHPRPVGSRRPNPWGLYDMHGNAMEWVQDYAAPYTPEAKVDPAGPATGTSRAIR